MPLAIAAGGPTAVLFKGAEAAGGLEERVAFLEGRMVEHSRMMDGIRDAIISLEERMDRRFEVVDRPLDGIGRRVDGLDTRLSRQFTWIVGLHVTTLAAVVAALLAR